MTSKTLETIRLIGSQNVTLTLVEEDETSHAHYVMSGPSGSHTLDACETSPERLAKHWAGFCLQNDVENDAMLLANADPKRIESSEKAASECKRARYLIALLESQIEATELKAARYDVRWDETGSVQHLVAKLAELIDPDAEAGTLAAIDDQIAEMVAA